MSEVRVILKSVFDDKGVKSAQKEFGQIGKTLGVAFAAVGAAVGGAAIALTRFGLDAVRGAEEAAIAQRRLDQVAESMGLFGAAASQVSKRLGEFAEANELIIGVDADVIKSTQAKLLTFKNLAQTADVVGGSMDRATMAALDLAATGFGSAETNAVQLGKALQDPIKGITALARAGVTFTEAEKEKIKALVESGNVLEAQNQILSAIENQVGGTAEATVSAFTRIQLASNQVKDAVGEALLPVFEDLADQLVDIVPALSAALAPAAENVAQIFRNQVLPALANFTRFLGSPQGTKLLTDLTQAVVDSIKAFIDFTGFVFKNRDAIVSIGTALLVTIGALKTYEFVVKLAAATTALLGAAAAATPFGLLAAAIFVLVAAVTALGLNATAASTDLEALEMEALALEQELANLESQLLTAIDPEQVQVQIDAIKVALEGVRLEAGALNNTANLKKFRSQLGDTRIEAEKLTAANRELFLAMGGTITAAMSPAAVTTSITPTGSTGPTAFEQTQKIIQDAQKKLRDATKRYNTAIASATKSYNATIFNAEKTYQTSLTNATINRDKSLSDALTAHNSKLSTIQRDFANRQADIIQSSIDRLRTAFADAVRTNVAQLFGTEEVGQSIDGLVTALRDRLTASQALLSNAAQLASQGFSQTFIEQVVSSGLTAGNELASAILEATPETRSELQSLFKSLETTSETGMDSLADTMFEKTGLATTELKRLFEQTQTDLVASLTQAELDYITSQSNILATFDQTMDAARATRDESFAQANAKLKEELDAAAQAHRDTVAEIKDAFLEQIEALENGLGGLERTVARFIAAMDAAIRKAAGRVPSTSSGFSAPVITPLPSPTAPRQAVPQPIININVKTDVTQSNSMVGKAIVKEVNKFTGGGGGLRGIKVIAI